MLDSKIINSLRINKPSYEHNGSIVSIRVDDFTEKDFEKMEDIQFVKRISFIQECLLNYIELPKEFYNEKYNFVGIKIRQPGYSKISEGFADISVAYFEKRMFEELTPYPLS